MLLLGFFVLVLPVSTADVSASFRVGDIAKNEGGAKSSPDRIMTDAFRFWSSMRDRTNGLWCDHIDFKPRTECDGRQYSSAGTGMGLVTDALFAELGLLTNANASAQSLQTLRSLENWPQDGKHGFYRHFTDKNYRSGTELSTVDTAELVLGALFAGNYFGGEVEIAARNLAESVDWSAAVNLTDGSIFGTFEPDGTPTSRFRNFNEYFLTAYLAHIFVKAENRSEVDHAIAKMWGIGVAAPTGLGTTCPFQAKFHGYELLTDGCTKSLFPSGFIPLFNSFLCGGFRKSKLYSTMFDNWRLAEQSFFDDSLNASSKIWGVPGARGRIWGSGAGPGPGGYAADSISHNPFLVASPHVMAGFLDRSDVATRAAINEQIRWLADHNVCMYKKTLVDNTTVRLPWRCSVTEPDWRASSADGIDLSTFLFGYGTNFIGYDFFGRYAVGSSHNRGLDSASTPVFMI